MKIPFFSIIIPTYNRADMISKAIDSVIGQSFSDWELIIVDDGGSDHTRSVVDGFKDHRIQYHWQENRGRSAARNIGLSMVRGKYIIFLDDDDWFLENHLQCLYDASSEGDEYTILKTGAMILDHGHQSSEGFIADSNLNSEEYIWCNGISLFQIAVPNTLALSTSFNTNIHYGEDLLWVMSMTIKGAQIKEILASSVVINNHTNRSSYLNSKLAILDRYHQIYKARGELLDLGIERFIKSNLIDAVFLKDKQTCIKTLVKKGFLWAALKLYLQ